MSKELRVSLGLLLAIGLLFSLPGIASASKLPDGGVPVKVMLKQGGDAAALKSEIEARGGKVLSLNPEGSLLVSMPESKVKVLGVLKNVEGVEEMALPAPGPAFDGIGKMGVKKPSPERMKEIEAVTVKVSGVSANDLAIKRAALEGKSAKAGKNGGGAVIMALPSSVDNSTSQYFPPIGDQGSQGSCAAWATAYYWNTYTQAKDENLNASVGNMDVVNSPAFIYNLCNGGSDSGAFPADLLVRMNDVGCSSWTLMPYSDANLTNWPSEAAWIQALNNKPINHYSISMLTQSGLDAVKQQLANGNVVATTTDCYSNWGLFGGTGNPSRGVSNGVIFSHAGESYTGSHALCIVGYDDNKSYNDGTTTQYGAILVANSWGSGWGATNSVGTKGFLWVAYPYVLAGNSCFDSVDYNDDRDNYRSQLYAVAGLNHTQRGRVSYKGGVGADPANPVWSSAFAINTDGGNNVAIDDTKRVTVDLTGGISSISDMSNVNLFAKMYVSSSAGSNGTISSADFFHDFNADGVFFQATSTDTPVTVTPGTNGSAKVQFDATANHPPVAEAGPDKWVRANAVVTFVGAGSSDPDGDTLTYAWQFGDGATASGKTATHVYTVSGVYTVTLTVDDGHTGGTDSDTCEAEVLPAMVPINQWLQGSIHYHTTNSDGSETLQTMVTTYRDVGTQDWSCVGDHNYVSNANQYSTGNFLGVNGVEASNGPHVVGFGMNTSGSFSPATGLQTQINAIVADGGLPIVSHPKWSQDYAGYGMAALIESMSGCKHIEVFNWYCQDLWGWGNAEQIWDTVLSNNKFVYGTAGDDAHGLGRSGYTYNMVGASSLSLASLKSAFNIGDSYFCYSTTKWAFGITLTGYTVTGNQSGNSMTVNTDSGTSIQFIGADGTVLQTNSGSSATYNFIGVEGYVRAKITNGDNDVTWTQPVEIVGEPIPPPPPPPIEAYQGYEPITTGGEGGTVVWVTNLNDSGAGSLREALSNLTGEPTMIKFAVGGSIPNTGLGIYKPNVTIAGETAPGVGITLACSGYRGIEMNTHDVIIRYLRIRNAGGEAVQIFGDYNIIVDHCSLTNCGDGATDVNNGSHHVIVSRNLYGEATEAHRTYGENTSFHHNLYNHCNRRQPKIVCQTGPFDFRNNVVEYWTNTGTNMVSAHGVNIINNWYGPPAPGESWTAGLINSGATNVYTAGNYCEGDPNINNKGDLSSPNPEPNVTTVAANQAMWQDVHRNCGALPRDSIDESYAGPSGNSAPVANAGQDQTVYTGDVVQFDGSASYDPDETPLSYSWNFGDNATGSGAQPTHIYSNAGTYIVALTVYDGVYSDTDTCRIQVLQAGMPAAEAGPDQSAAINQVLTFDGSGSSDPDNDPLDYEWQFGDGATASGVTVTHAYSTAGNKTVTLTVDDGLYQGSDTCLVSVKVSYQVTFKSLGAEDGEVTESSETSGVGGSHNVAATVIRPGDLNTRCQRIGLLSFDTSTLPDNAEIVSATIRMRRSAIDNNPQSLGDLVADINSPYFGGSTSVEEGDFQSVADATAVAIMSFPGSNGTWSEGSVAAEGLYYLNKTGRTQFRIRFIIDDNDNSLTDDLRFNSGNDSAAYQPQLVVNYLGEPINSPPNAEAGSNKSVYKDTVVTFDGSGSSDPDGDPLTYSWTFGDGGTKSGCTVTHSYSSNGTYTVTLVVNDGSQSDDDICTVTVEESPNQPPVAEAGSDKTAQILQVVTFDGSGSSDPEMSPLTYVWNFGDGATKSGCTVTHTYATAAVYTATLTVNDGQLSDDDTCKATINTAGPQWSETADYYVDGVSGLDTNPGTSSAPYKTINKAEDVARAGKKVLIWGGQTYNEQITFGYGGSSGSPITFKRDPASGTATINGGGTTYGVVYCTAIGYIVIDGFTITNGKYGVYIYGDACDNWTIKNCRITANTQHGIYVRAGDNATIFNNIVDVNGASYYGIYIYNGATGCNVTQCDVYNQKYGIYYDTSASGEVKDCIVTSNTTYGIRNRSSTLTITYSDVWSNGANYNGCSAGTGCISSDPLYVNAGGGDFHLQSGSPCDNAGSDGGDMGYRF